MATIEVKKVYKLIRNNGTHSFFTEDKLEHFQKYCEKFKAAGLRWENSISTYKSEIKDAVKWICVEK